MHSAMISDQAMFNTHSVLKGGRQPWGRTCQSGCRKRPSDPSPCRKKKRERCRAVSRSRAVGGSRRGSREEIRRELNSNMYFMLPWNMQTLRRQATAHTCTSQRFAFAHIWHRSKQQSRLAVWRHRALRAVPASGCTCVSASRTLCIWWQSGTEPSMDVWKKWRKKDGTYLSRIFCQAGSAAASFSYTRENICTGTHGRWHSQAKQPKSHYSSI